MHVQQAFHAKRIMSGYLPCGDVRHLPAFCRPQNGHHQGSPSGIGTLDRLKTVRVGVKEGRGLKGCAVVGSNVASKL